MAVIGIMRYGCDNDYTFIAEKEENGILENIAVYHENNSTMLPIENMKYEKAILLNEGRTLALPGGDIIFDAEEVFPTFTIDDKTYQSISNLGDIIHTAHEQGFNGRVVNGQPMAVCH
jgi:hypothetical protein